MEVICLQDDAFYALVDEVVLRIKRDNNVKEDKWINGEDAMRLLNIKSKTSLQNLRDEGKIRFSQPQKKVILYDRDSINDYLDDYAHETF